MRLYEARPGKLKFLSGQENAPEGATVYDVVGCGNIDYSYNNACELVKHIRGPQHLDLNKKKRNAEEAELGEGGGKKEKKVRMGRKDKGVIKKKLGPGLAGAADEEGGEIAALGDFDGNNPGVLPAPTSDPFPSWYREKGYAYLDNLDSCDDSAALTGSETMLEGEVFTTYGRGGDVTLTSDYPTLD